jgi:carboxyl-terminal processing protease
MKKRFIFWIAPVVVLSIVIIAAAAPRVQAQGRGGKSEVPDSSYIVMVQYVFDFIQKHFVDEVDAKTVYEGAMTGMFNALGDPYSQYMVQKDIEELNQNVIQGSYGGVGLYITKALGERLDGNPAWVEVAAPIEDGPGWKAGVQPGDFITKINDIGTETLSLDEVLAVLKGPAGEKVNIMIRRGAKLEFEVALTRAVIEVPTVKSAMIGDIGYLKLISFSKNTAERSVEAINAFKKENYRKLILDLRNNYGGLLDQAVKVSDLFIPGGAIVTVKSRIKEQNAAYTAKPAVTVPTNVPVVVLINKGSASASEIVAGALKDRGRGYLVGEKSFGKGSVQQVYPLGDAGFKITTARYYTPSDVNIDKKGIPPDKEVFFPEMTSEDTGKLQELIRSKKIIDFVGNFPDASQREADAFAAQLQLEYDVNLDLVRRLIRDEQNRTIIAPIFDLDYDVQLKEAVRILNTDNWANLMKSSKTLKQLQDEVEDADAVAT